MSTVVKLDDRRPKTLGRDWTPDDVLIAVCIDVFLVISRGYSFHITEDGDGIRDDVLDDPKVRWFPTRVEALKAAMLAIEAEEEAAAANPDDDAADIPF